MGVSGLAYFTESEPEKWEMMNLSQQISREKNVELKETLEDMDEFFELNEFEEE